MSVEKSLERIGKEVCKLPKEGRRIFLCWAAARAGVPLDTEASFEALGSRIVSFEDASAIRLLKELEQDLEIASRFRE
jgi:hypothetical protein